MNTTNCNQTQLPPEQREELPRLFKECFDDEPNLHQSLNSYKKMIAKADKL
jgi:hypothetical protein